MKVAIDYQSGELSAEENEYYLELVKQLSSKDMDGKEYFRDLFTTDDRGFINLIKPKNSIPWIVLFFIQQIMISQRLRKIDDFMSKQENKWTKH